MSGREGDAGELLERLAEISPDAAALLSLCACFDVERPIPVAALDAGIEALPLALRDALRDSGTRERMWDALLDAGAGGVAGGDLVLNAEAARGARDRLDGDARRRWAGAAAEVMEHAFPGDPVREEDRALCERLYPHALAVTAHAADAGAGLDAAAQVLHLAGRYALEVRARYADARAVLEQGAALRGRAHGDDDPRVAWDLTYLNGALLHLGEWAAMARNAVRAAEILEAERGPTDRTVVTHVNNAALLLMRAGDLAAARTWFLRALERAEAAFGAAHPFTATLLSNVGDLCLQGGDASGAREAYGQALEIDQRVYGPGHNSVARDLAKLGELLAGLGDGDAARPYLERAAAWYLETAGPDDARTRAVQATLARLGSAAPPSGG
jgi:tetratricopeptide (TPR) repeat protein